jgi:hypothetical protein
LPKPLERSAARFDYVRVERWDELPPQDPRSIDVAVLDMNHRAPNVGHDAIVAILRDIALDLDAELEHGGRRIRAISYAVRDRLIVPRHDGRHRLYLGTGGPGHLDPRRNTEDRGDEQIREDPAWEAPLWKLFDAVAADERSALYGVCHTFGLLCRWSGIAEPIARGSEKGGKMSGVGTNVLTPEALRHPWFGGLAGELPSPQNVPVLDSRYYDLVPVAALPRGITAIAYESAVDGEGHGDALTMVEFARDRDNATPRMFAVNSHPEIGSADRVAELLDAMLARGTITAAVYASRSRMLPMLRNDRSALRLRVARYVFDDLARRQLERLAPAS